MARDQVIEALARRSRGGEAPTVWCWDDAWRAAARASDNPPPARLSPAGRSAALGEAIERARRSGTLEKIGRAVELPGYRRRLRDRFAAWTTEERDPDRAAPGESAVDRDEWAVFGNYRATLRELGAVDPEGFAAWASGGFLHRPPPELARPGAVVVIDPVSPTRAQWRLLETCHKRARSMTVTLPFDPEPALAEQYAAVEPARRRFLEWGFDEEGERRDGFSFRPGGLDFVERELFRADVLGRPRLDRPEGLQVLGGPKGEGLGLLVAREVADRVAGGIPPEEILILVPRLDEDAERIREALDSWGLPVASPPARPLSSLPSVAALRMASRLPAGRWDASTLIRLLRNGQVRWEGGHLGTEFGPPEAASAIRSTRVFRDREPLRRALGSALERKPKDRPTLAALEAIDRLSGWLDPVARPGPWTAQVDRLRRLAGSMGLDPAELGPLWDALEDRGWVLAGLGPAIAEEALPWKEFAGRVDELVAEIQTPESPALPGTIRIEAVGAAEGARARVVILANLSESTFPRPEAVPLNPAPEPAGGADLAYSREILRFARAAGMAEDRLVLAYPTTDVDGAPLLPAGFLDDLIRRLSPRARASCLGLHARFDPVLAGHEDLARSPGDARVLAVALACRDVDPDRLRRLAGTAEHLDALGGTADALAVASRRRDDRSFGPYDGRLRDPAAIVRIAADFGPDHAFSPTQLESFAFCPFQFYQRFVLGLKVVDEREELDEDYAGRGSHVHDVLERIHQQVAAEGGADLLGRLEVLIATDMRVELERFDGAEADVAEVLREIGARRTNKSLARYLGQFRAYAARDGEEAEPHQFEVTFGQPDDERSRPHLAIGSGGDRVLLQGKIDRVDLIRKDGQVRFRVIDYKTGSCPPARDVQSGLASQLPLYALALERLVFPSGEVGLIDVGYWSLKKDGYRSVKVGAWEDYRDRLVEFVVGLVGQLRGGSFPIDSPRKDCRKACDFGTGCRVVEVRGAGKSWDARPTLEAGR